MGLAASALKRLARVDSISPAWQTTKRPRKRERQFILGEELLTVYPARRKAGKSDTYEEIGKMLEAHPREAEYGSLHTEVMVFRRASRHKGETANEFAIRLQATRK
jgi:hypothetical protein